MTFFSYFWLRHTIMKSSKKQCLWSWITFLLFVIFQIFYFDVLWKYCNENTKSFVKQKEIISLTNLRYSFFQWFFKICANFKGITQKAFFKINLMQYALRYCVPRILNVCVNSQLNKYPRIQVTSKSEHFRDAAIMNGTIVGKLRKTNNNAFQRKFYFS